MAIGPVAYFIRGAHPRESASTLEEALALLQQFWEARPSLAVHVPGNMVITVTMGGRTFSFEIVDPALLESWAVFGPTPILEAIKAQLGLSDKDAEDMLGRWQATVQIDCLQDPRSPGAWSVGSTPQGGADRDLGTAMREERPALVGQLLREREQERRRGARRPRTADEVKLVRDLLQQGRAAGQTIAQISRSTGLPASTLRDIERGARPRPPRPPAAGPPIERAPRQRLTPTQRAQVVAALQRIPNATEVAAQLGLPPRTVRDIRAAEARAARAPARPLGQAPARRRYSAEERAQITRQLQSAMTADRSLTVSEAARTLGLPERTARDWARQAKLARAR